MTSSMITALLLLLSVSSTALIHDPEPPTAQPPSLSPRVPMIMPPVTNPVAGTGCAEGAVCPPTAPSPGPLSPPPSPSPVPLSPPPPATCPPPAPSSPAISPSPFPWPGTSPPPFPFPFPFPFPWPVASPPPPPLADRCPIDILKMGACVDLFGGLVHIGLGDPAAHKCCPMIAGLIEIEAAMCLCTTLRIKALSLNLYIPLALQFLVTCGKTPPPGYNCFF